MMMFVLPPVALIILAAAIRSGRWVVWAMLATIVLTYAGALGLISLDPYFDDNGAREYIDWRYRWIWAAEIAGWLSLLTVPAALMLGMAIRHIRGGGGRRNE